MVLITICITSKAEFAFPIDIVSPAVLILENVQVENRFQNSCTNQIGTFNTFQ